MKLHILYSYIDEIMHMRAYVSYGILGHNLYATSCLARCRWGGAFSGGVSVGCDQSGRAGADSAGREQPLGGAASAGTFLFSVCFFRNART